jgi:hypothetical protein
MAVFSRLRQLLWGLLEGEPAQFERQLPPGDPRRTDSLVDGVEDGGAVVSALVDGGVLVEQGQDLVLSTGFRESWREAMAELREMGDGALARAVDNSAPGVDEAVLVDDSGRDFVVVLRDDEQLWVSRPVAIAEVGAMRALPETVPPEPRLAAPRPLRLFLEECPACQGRADFVAASDWPASDHPSEDSQEYLVCYDCGETLYSR